MSSVALVVIVFLWVGGAVYVGGVIQLVATNETNTLINV